MTSLNFTQTEASEAVSPPAGSFWQVKSKKRDKNLDYIELRSMVRAFH